MAYIHAFVCVYTQCCPASRELLSKLLPGIVQVERIELGEEVDYDYVATTIEAGIELWNGCLDSIRDKLSDPEKVLSELDKQGEANPELDLQEALKATQERLTCLRKIDLSPTGGAFKLLVFQEASLLF